MRGPDFDTIGRDWPHRSASRFIESGGLRWHVQIMGDDGMAKPVLMLVHGTGATTHSWRDLVPLLMPHFQIVAMDLAGHGFTDLPQGADANRLFSVDGMAQSLAGLLGALNLAPDIAAGHSAGAAILARMCLSNHMSPAAIVGLNAAMRPMPIVPARFFTTLAHMAAGAPMMPAFFAWRASDMRMVTRLIEGTGSKLDQRGLELYRTMGAQPRHVAAAFRMMANWNMERLFDELPRLQIPLHLIVGDNDLAIPPDDSKAVAQKVRKAQLHRLPGLGHLAHEEDPKAVAALLVDIFTKTTSTPEPIKKQA